MSQDGMNRREFTTLAAAAIGGIVVGCKKKEKSKTGDGSEKKTGAGGMMTSADHACRGLNDCKNQGKSKENACRGQGTCATVEHSCGGENACKNQGGCQGKFPNACKGKGGCHVPIKDKDNWAKARAAYEAQWNKDMKKFGDAPKA